MERLRVQNEIERSTSEDFGSKNIHMLLDENDTVYIAWITIEHDNIATCTLLMEGGIYVLQISIA